MAQNRKSSSATTQSNRRIGLSGPRSPFQLVETKTPQGKARTAAGPQPLAIDGDDPSGIKGFIAFSVAHALFPKGGVVDPDQDISDDVKLNSGTIAAEVNVDASHSAAIHQLTWDPVTAAQVSQLSTVGDLMDLIKAHLSDTATGGGE